MLRSMTGYGQSVRTISGYRLQIDVKSVNHRYNEVVVRMPREWMIYEEHLRKIAQQLVRRGRIDIFVTVERDPTSGQQAAVNWPLVESLYQAAEEIRRRLNLPEEERIGLRDLIAVPEVLMPAEDELEDSDLMRESLEECLREAMQQLLAMREAEGRNLREDLVSRIRTVEKLREQIGQEAPLAVEHMRQKMRQRIQQLLEDPTWFDDQRFTMEVAVMAERSDIDEELARLSSHCQQFHDLLDADEPVGRKLDFLIQEMNREVNTIGSKANYAAITNLVVELKAELEKIREQVQNIE